MDDPRSAPLSGAGVLGVPDLAARLERWVAEARSDEAAASRARERWLRVQADESATFAGVLVDLAERSTPVLIQGRGGRKHRGTVVAVAQDFCALRTTEGRDVLLAFSGIGSIRPDARAPGPVGDRVVHAEVGLCEMLAVLASDRPRVLIVTVSEAEGVAGELRSVGRDVVTVRLDGQPRPTAYVAVTAIAEVSLV